MNFLCIHEILDHIVTTSPENTDFCSFEPGQQAFEETLVNTCDRLSIPREGTAALSIWGDYAKYHTRDSIALLLWSFLSGPIRTRYWIAGFAKRQGCACGCGQRHTLDAMFKVIGWMLRVLLSGVWPSVRHDDIAFIDSDRPGDKERAKMAGQPLPFRCVIQKKCADWSWFKGALSLTGWSKNIGRSNQKSCFKCQADCMDIPWTDPSKTAKWRPTAITMKTFWAWVIFTRSNVSPIFGWPGFVYDMLDADWMHTVDLGVTLIVLGNCFLDYFQDLGGTHADPTDALAKLLNLVKCAAKCLKMKDPIWDLTMGMIQSSSGTWPVLKLKAGEARYMVPVNLYIATHFFPTQSRYQRTRLDMLRRLQKCYDLLQDFDAEAMGAAARSFNMIYNQLNRMALSENPMSVRWRLYPKFHLMIHICESGENPRESWNYMDESAIGDSASLAESCQPASMHKTLIGNYRVLHFRRKQ